MQPPYDAALREAVRMRMSPLNRESVTEIARDTGITPQTIYNWRSQWQKQGLLVPASTRPPEQWSAADKLAAVIQATGLQGVELGVCRTFPQTKPPLSPLLIGVLSAALSLGAERP